MTFEIQGPWLQIQLEPGEECFHRDGAVKQWTPTAEIESRLNLLSEATGVRLARSLARSGPATLLAAGFGGGTVLAVESGEPLRLKPDLLLAASAEAGLKEVVPPVSEGIFRRWIEVGASTLILAGAGGLVLQPLGLAETRLISSEALAACSSSLSIRQIKRPTRRSFSRDDRRRPGVLELTGPGLAVLQTDWLRGREPKSTVG
ncbi:MAG: AIM24 family protein [Fimbriimonadaceae bacterium]|nr:AIM24 family protein [Fimbriimonadaceae bacterium]